MIARLVPTVSLFLLILLSGLLGGSALPFDQAVVRHFVEWRGLHPEATGALILVTQLGGAVVLVPAVLLAAAIVSLRSTPAAIALLATAYGGRLLIELIKLIVDRPRPLFDPHPVYVFSQSFPSGHAGNTMISYGAIALFALPQRWRAVGLIAAAALSLTVGATRPILGVHWPTDVLGAWCLGLLWLMTCWTAWQRFRMRST